jgi:hypothetical protein
MASELDSVIQVLRKDDYSQQTLCTLPGSGSGPPDELPPSSVRVRTTIIALTVNNLSYAIGGDMLHWWDTYPVPASLPAPNNDRSRYGIVGAWGYGVVLESSTSLVPGTQLKGYFPISTLPTVLRLVPAAAQGHWKETSRHREKLFPLYQRYIAAGTSPSAASLTSSQPLAGFAWDVMLGVLWECAYLLNRLSFPSSGTVRPIHPSGGGPWTDADADLREAVVVLLAASGKTALSFAQQLRDARVPGSGPLTVVGITSSAATAFVQGSGFYSTVLSYDDLRAPDALLSAVRSPGQPRAKRLLLCDFGARGTVTEDVYGVLQEGLSGTGITTLGVGFEARVYTAAELQGMGARIEKLGLVQLNTSALRDRAMEIDGEEQYFTDMLGQWREFKEAGCVPGMQPRWGQGMVGDDGVEGFWTKLCSHRDTDPAEGFVLRL